MSSVRKQAVAAILGIAARALFAVSRKHDNEFAFAVIKTDKSKPWIEKGALAARYELGFDPSRYVKERAA